MALDINDPNNKAKIEIRAKPIDSAPSTNHLYIIYTVYNDAGDKIEYYFRGGPGLGDGSLGGSFGGAPEVIFGGGSAVNPMEYFGNPFGSITTESGVYSPYALDSNGVPIIDPKTGVPYTGTDWFTGAPSATIITGTQSEIEPYITSISDQMNAIELAHYRYNPITQNSNTTAWQALINAGLSPHLPTYNDGTTVWAPGFDQHFKTPLQELQDYLSTASNSIKNWVSTNYHDLAASANELLDIFKPIPVNFINGLESMHQNYLDLISQFKNDIELHGYLGTFQNYINKITSGIHDLGDAISDAFHDFLHALGLSSIVDPLIIDMNNNGIALNSWQTSNVLFDLNGDGVKDKTGWTKAGGDDAFLVIDKNSNNNIDNINEMFGNSNTKGFNDLASYDSNGDHVINSADAQFSLLKLWNDKNANGVVDAGEMTTLAANGITSISLNSYWSNVNNNGNLQTDVSTVTKSDGTTRSINEFSFAIDSAAFTSNPDLKLPANFQLNVATLLNDNLAIEKQLIYAMA